MDVARIYHFNYSDDQFGGLDERALQVFSDDGSGWINFNGFLSLSPQFTRGQMMVRDADIRQLRIFNPP